MNTKNSSVLVSELPLNRRTRLSFAGHPDMFYSTVSDFVQKYTREDVLGLHGMGLASLNDLERAFINIGFTLN